MKKTKKSGDTNLAVISIILGATSFFYTVFTGIPAIILGIMALRRKAGDPLQAKLGIAFGIVGSLLLIPIIWLLVHFLQKPFSQQFSVSTADHKKISDISEAVGEYKKKYKSYPTCTSLPCDDWEKLYEDNPGLARYPMDFEPNSYQVEDRANGTLVFALETTCFINTPADPKIRDEEDDFKKINPADYAALVYFHEKGRACRDVYDD